VDFLPDGGEGGLGGHQGEKTLEKGFLSGALHKAGLLGATR